MNITQDQLISFAKNIMVQANNADLYEKAQPILKEIPQIRYDGAMRNRDGSLALLNWTITDDCKAKEASFCSYDMDVNEVMVNYIKTRLSFEEA